MLYVLTEGKDYTVVWSDASSKNTGTYTATIKGEGTCSGTAKATYTIKKAANPLTVKAKKATVKYNKLKKNKRTLAVGKVLKFNGKGVGKLTYTKVSGNNKITINKNNGTVTVKKKLKKGTYKVKVKVKAAGDDNYYPLTLKPVTFKIIVK